MKKQSILIVVVIAIVIGFITNIILANAVSSIVSNRHSPSATSVTQQICQGVVDTTTSDVTTYGVGYPLRILIEEHTEPWCVPLPLSNKPTSLEKITKTWQFYVNWAIWSVPFLALGYVVQKKLSVR